MALDGTLESAQRQERLLNTLWTTGSLRIKDAAVELGVSEMTIRRDLDELERTHDIRRVRGGATSPGVRPFQGREKQNIKAKTRIAEKLTSLIPSHGNIALDSSSTLLRLIPLLEASDDQYIVTNGLRTMDALIARGTGRPVLTGGEPYPDEALLLGPLACATASALAYTRYFCSANAIHPRIGATHLSIEGTAIHQAFASTSGELVLAVDSSKLGGVSTAVSFQLREVDYLVTELDPGDPRLEDFAGLTEIL
ncbi:MAG: DeoR/GlpR family DNA-binding transcription regulator [Propionicimonas sp.]|nr:DeoR/GlpR family DNA-binding transcription regulator [Propionicimonas sp.]